MLSSLSVSAGNQGVHVFTHTLGHIGEVLWKQLYFQRDITSQGQRESPRNEMAEITGVHANTFNLIELINITLITCLWCPCVNELFLSSMLPN